MTGVTLLVMLPLSYWRLLAGTALAYRAPRRLRMREAPGTDSYEHWVVDYPHIGPILDAPEATSLGQEVPASSRSLPSPSLGPVFLNLNSISLSSFYPTLPPSTSRIQT